MPNFCDNTLHIEGADDEIQRFLDSTTIGEHTYEILKSLYPVPQELTDTVSGWSSNEEEQAEREKQYARNTEKYGYKDWYDWQNANWGTKWGDCDTQLVGRNTDYVCFTFESAWGPPSTAFVKISQDFPTLTFYLTYHEKGMGFAGCDGFRNGEHVDSYTEDISIPNADEDDEMDWEALDDAYLEAMDSCEKNVREMLS